MRLDNLEVAITAHARTSRDELADDDVLLEPIRGSTLP